MKAKLFVALVSVLLISNVYASKPVLKNDSKRPVDKISKDLGMTSEQFVACFNPVYPTLCGNRSESGARVHANKGVLLPCLQKANSSITNESLEKVIHRYRPGGEKSQESMEND